MSLRTQSLNGMKNKVLSIIGLASIDVLVNLSKVCVRRLFCQTLILLIHARVKFKYCVADLATKTNAFKMKFYLQFDHGSTSLNISQKDKADYNLILLYMYSLAHPAVGHQC